jgi:DNA polymerase elongation subunit (family B)
MKGNPQPPISFQLLNIYYVPEDNDLFYLEGRSKNPEIGGVCALATFPSFFFLERWKPFSCEEEVRIFLKKVQSHLDTLPEVNINNQYKADIYKGEKLKEKLHRMKEEYSRRTGTTYFRRDPTSMNDFCTGFELISGKHKTFAHFMPDKEFLNVVKVYVKSPYMCASLHAYFESLEYESAFRESKGPYDHLVRTYLGTMDPTLLFSVESGVSRGRWCTLKKYELIRQTDQKRVYKKTNLFFDVADIVCDHLNVEPSPLRILSFDCEMVPRRNPTTGIVNHRFPRPLARKLTPSGQPSCSSDAEANFDGDVLDADLVTVICALVFEDSGGGEPKLKEGRAFVYVHPDDHPERTLEEELETWRVRIRELVAKACAKMPSFDVADLVEFWGYDKLRVFEYHSEMEPIYAFEDYLHESDIDILAGWNQDGFDLPFLFKRWQHHRYVLKKTSLRQPNFGLLVGGRSELRSFYKKKPEEGGGVGIVPKATASAKTQKSYDTITTPHLTGNDGLLIWKTDHMKEKPHNLNAVSQRTLSFPKPVVAVAVALAKLSCSEVLDNSNEQREGGGDDEEREEEMSNSKKGFPVSELLSNPTRKSFLVRKTSEGLDSLFESYTNPASKESFPMKKIEFHHAHGIRYWETGGLLMLKFLLYCSIDCKLPAMLLKSKGKMQAQLSFCMVSGVNFEDVVARGQQAKVSSTLYVYSKKLHDGLFLVYDKGYHHYHWPGVWRNSAGPAAAVARDYDRLKPFYGTKGNEGGRVQDPGGYGLFNCYVTTEDAASLYPSIMETLNLCSTSYVNSKIISMYQIPRWEFATFTLGSASLNMAGEHVLDHSKALALGCPDDNLKVTHFHQTCKTVVPYVVRDLRDVRGNAKKAKAAWLLLFDYLKLMEEQGKGGVALERLEDERVETASNGGSSEKEKEALGKHLGLLEKHASLWSSSGNEELSIFINNPKIVSLLKAVCSWSVELPAEPKDLYSKNGCVVLNNMLKNVEALPSAERTPIVLQQLCETQADNFEHYQLGVKCLMNSLYGVLMRVAGSLALPEISATVTAFGRDLITMVKCLVERQTTDHAKRHLGISGFADCNDPEAAKRVFSEEEVRGLVAVGKMLRGLPEGFVTAFKKWLTSYQAICVIYGDTDSVMNTHPKHNVVNIHQAFEVMRFLVELINAHFPKGKMLKFEDEKISECTKLDMAKNYDMRARYKIEKHKVKPVLAGSGKSDTLPFVNELLEECKNKLLSAVAEGYTAREATQLVVFIVKKKLLEFAMGLIPSYQLTITMRLKEVKPNATSQHGTVANKMIARGVPVNGGDDVTFIYVKHKITGEKDVESLDHMLDPLNQLEPDLPAIWENRMKKKITTFLSHLLVPIEDITLLASVYPDVEQEKLRSQNEQLVYQREYLSLLMYRGEGDVESRFAKREILEKRHRDALGALEITRSAVFSEPNDPRSNEEVRKRAERIREWEERKKATLFPSQIECRVCYRFFDPKSYRFERCRCAKDRSKKVAKKPNAEPVRFFGRSTKHESRPTKAPLAREERLCPCGGKSKPIHEFELATKKHNRGRTNEEEEEEDERRTERGIKRKRQAHVPLVYDGDDDCDSQSENRYYRVFTGKYSRICPSCESNRTKHVEHFKALHKETMNDYFRNRAICLTCIEAAQVPTDPVHPDSPETCTLIGCAIYKKRMTLWTAGMMYDEQLSFLGAHHESW